MLVILGAKDCANLKRNRSSRTSGAKILILLGAGSSSPFGIPAMGKFVEMFEGHLLSSEDSTLSSFLMQIRNAFSDSQNLVGTRITFDLESLMVILQDLTTKDRPISTPTFAFMLQAMSNKGKEIGAYNIENIRKTYSEQASRVLRLLRNFVFNVCMEPIKAGQRSNDSFSFLDRFFGPLFVSLGGTQEYGRTQCVFTTNWDLCLKQWLEYARLRFEDGTQLDNQRKPVLNPFSGWSGENVRKIVPLHGSLDLVKVRRLVSTTVYEEIEKVTAPETFFEGNPSEIDKAFIIYPLEAVGFEQSVKSPYLDMLNLMKQTLRSENEIFVIGFSFRDPTIASIFDEIVREKAQRGQEKDMKIFLITRSPEIVIDNLVNQGYTNIGNALIPVKVSFPDVTDKTKSFSEVLNAMQEAITLIVKTLHQSGVSYDYLLMSNALKKYGILIPDYAKEASTRALIDGIIPDRK